MPGDSDCEALDPTLAAPNLGLPVDYLDVTAATAPDHNRYYLVQWLDAEVDVAATSQRVGAFSFILVPGTIAP